MKKSFTQIFLEIYSKYDKISVFYQKSLKKCNHFILIISSSHTSHTYFLRLRPRGFSSPEPSGFRSAISASVSRSLADCLCPGSHHVPHCPLVPPPPASPGFPPSPPPPAAAFTPRGEVPGVGTRTHPSTCPESVPT